MSILSTLQTEMDKLLLCYKQACSQRSNLTLQISSTDTWAAKANNASIRKQILDLDIKIAKLKIFTDLKTSELRTHLDALAKFTQFLQPILKAGYIVYDDGKLAYTAQQLKFLKANNDFMKGFCFHNPTLYEEAEIYFRTQGISLKNKIMPGNPEMLSDEYKKYIESDFTDLRGYCFDKTIALVAHYNIGVSHSFK